MTTLFQRLVMYLRETSQWKVPVISSMFRSKLPHWSSENISDQWFTDHFEGAAPIIHEWLNAEMEMPGASLLDFGCGDGITDLAIALKYRPKNMIGVDITSTFTNLNEIAARQIGLNRLPKNLSFQKIVPGQGLVHILKIDAIFTWSTFEHIERPHLDTVVADLFDLLPQGGLFFLQIEPLYYSPFGSHLGRFIKQPWAHLLLDEETLKRTVLEYSDDIPANEKEYNFYVRTFEEYKAFIYGEFLKLNKLTAEEVVDLFCGHGFKEIRKESYRVALPVPDILLEKYPEEDILTNEIRLLLQKP
ncbi:MAG: SAM-dependent methyltransferase [Deltaproteobacteria bacterium]|nr:MAG: SAM-dependent methyltransferase [Deltaproteobacteria bacterium]